MHNEPNIYICSTVRHLLFSLLRASKLCEESHHILFFSDYQQTSLAEWDLRQLPGNIFVYDLARSEFRHGLGSSLRGRLCYLLAMRNIRAPALLLAPLRAMVARYTPPLSEQLATMQPRLWLFNERNRMARLFRLLVNRFSLIEDGEGNYLLQMCRWWKWPGRRARGLPARSRVFGEEKRCDTIWVLHPERLPDRVRHKGRQIDFLDGPAARDLISRVFRDRAAIAGGVRQIILATQPFGIPGVSKDDKQRVYGRIVNYLSAQGRQVVLKVHPAEDVRDYDFLGDRVIRVPAKIPLEAMLLGSASTQVVLSVLSTAGMGFERYCTRIKLCEDSADDALYFQTVQHWVAEPQLLDRVLKEKLSD